MKKLLGGLLLVVSVQGGLWAAACSDEITLKFSFKEQNRVKVQLEKGIFISTSYPLPVIKQFETLKNLLEDLGDPDPDSENTIPVHDATQQQFDILVEMLDLDNPKNAIPKNYDCKQVADLLKLAMLLENEKIENALVLELFKKLNQLSNKGLPTPKQQEAFNFIANANGDMFYAMSIVLEKLLKEGAHIDYNVLFGVPFEEATYFVFRRLDKDGDEFFQWENGNPVVEQGLIEPIMEVIQEEPKESFFTNQFYTDIQDNPAGARGRFAIIPEAKSFIIKIFLELSPAWKNLADNQKQLLINIFSYALTDPRKDILTYKCIERYPELLNQRLNKGYTPLMLATTRMRTSPEQIALVQKILALSPGTINMQNNDGYTALILATNNNNLAAVQALLGAGADRGIRGGHGYTPLMLAIFNRDLDIIQALLRGGAAIDIQDNAGYTALMIVSHDNNLAIVQALLNAGAAIDIQDNAGNTALIVATNNNHLAAVQTLLGAGANLNIQNNDGYTALMTASRNNNLVIVQALLGFGAAINMQSEYGYTALIIAVHYGNLAIARALLGAGANPNIQDNDGYTALMVAAYRGNLEIVNMLVSNGAVKYVQNKQGHTALNLAQQYNHPDIINILNIKKEKDDYCSMQ